MSKKEDAEILQSARFVTLAEINEWIGLPGLSFDLSGVLDRIRSIPDSIRRQGVINWVIDNAVGLFLLWLLAPLIFALFELERAIAMFFIELWFAFLPFMLFFVVLDIIGTVRRCVLKPKLKRFKALSRATVRFLALGSIYLVNRYYGQDIRAFIEQTDRLLF